MDENTLKSVFKQLTVWKTGGRRAPHKPLLILYTIAHCIHHQQRLLSFKEIEQDFAELMLTFFPQRQVANPNYPFWRLQKDDIWELENTEKVRVSSSGDASVKDLRTYNVKGGFTQTIYDLLMCEQKLRTEIIQQLLTDTFPQTIHDDILQAIGIDLEILVQKRNPKFREKVLQAYGYRCAVCGFDVRMRHIPVALEAAHIKWHTHGGTDSQDNGLALCSLHHKLFDRGAFTLSESLQIQVSELANGTTGYEEWLMAFHGKTITKPRKPEYQPNQASIAWHVKEVFLGTEQYFLK